MTCVQPVLVRSAAALTEMTRPTIRRLGMLFDLLESLTRLECGFKPGGGGLLGKLNAFVEVLFCFFEPRLSQRHPRVVFTLNNTISHSILRHEARKLVNNASFLFNTLVCSTTFTRASLNLLRDELSLNPC